MTTKICNVSLFPSNTKGWTLFVREFDADETKASYTYMSATTKKTVRKSAFGVLDSKIRDDALPTRFVWCLPHEVDEFVAKMKEELSKLIAEHCAKWNHYDATLKQDFIVDRKTGIEAL